MKLYLCPVCWGKGLVPPRFYDVNLLASTSACVETCRSCRGTGVLWLHELLSKPMLSSNS